MIGAASCFFFEKIAKKADAKLNTLMQDNGFWSFFGLKDLHV